MQEEPKISTESWENHEYPDAPTLYRAGDGPVPEEITGLVVPEALDPNGVNEAAPVPDWPELTLRERTVADGIVSGLNNHEIADACGINVKTYDTHRSNVLKKLGLTNVVQLTLLAVKRGYVTP